MFNSGFLKDRFGRHNKYVRIFNARRPKLSEMTGRILESYGRVINLKVERI